MNFKFEDENNIPVYGTAFSTSHSHHTYCKRRTIIIIMCKTFIQFISEKFSDFPCFLLCVCEFFFLSCSLLPSLKWKTDRERERKIMFQLHNQNGLPNHFCVTECFSNNFLLLTFFFFIFYSLEVGAKMARGL